MKKILLLQLLTLSFFCQAQTSEADTARRTEEYVIVVASSQAFSTKVAITLDYGQERKFFQNARFVKDESGKMVKFNSVVDALNYMNSQGWEFVSAYPMSSSQGNAYHYLMRRKILH